MNNLQNRQNVKKNIELLIKFAKYEIFKNC